MSEYIKREDALDAWYDNERFTDIEAIPAADVVEQKHGKWMEIRQGVIPSGYCSECEIWNRVTPYCPNCGAQMEIGDSEYDELIARLRETSIDFGESDHISVMMIEAADAIEELQKKSDCPCWYGDIQFCSMLGKAIR